MLGHRGHDRIAELIGLRNRLPVTRGKTPAQVEHPQIDPGLGRVDEQHCDLANGDFVGVGRRLLAADVQRKAVWMQAQFAGPQYQFPSVLDGRAELAGQRSVSALILHQDPAVHSGAGGLADELRHSSRESKANIVTPAS
jgi:hypothetical protein